MAGGAGVNDLTALFEMVPAQADLVELAVAGTLTLIALAAGVAAQRIAGARVAQWWRDRVGAHVEGLRPRIATIVRHGVAALLLAFVYVVWGWGPLAAAAIGFAMAAAATLTAHQLMRGVGIPRWAAAVVEVVVFTALFSHAVGGLEPITSTLDAIGVTVGTRRLSLLALVGALVTLVVLMAMVRLANRITAHTISHARAFDPTQKVLAQKIAGIAIVVFAFLFGIDLLGIDLTAFAVFSGAFGLAVGFGMQKTIGNLIAGIILLLDRSIKPGDVIAVGTSFGWVNKIGVRAVSVVTRDGKEYLIPNEDLMTREVENWSYSDRNVRVRISVRVPYDCELTLAQELMLRAARESPRVLDSPKPNVWLTAFGTDGVEHEILAWISDPESGVGNVRSDVLNRLWVMFRDAGIGMPFAQRDIYVRSMPETPPPPAP